jgi:hypothetical protein
MEFEGPTTRDKRSSLPHERGSNAVWSASEIARCLLAGGPGHLLPSTLILQQTNRPRPGGICPTYILCSSSYRKTRVTLVLLPAQDENKLAM